MGGQSSSTHTQQSQTSPWESARPILQGVLGKLSPASYDFVAKHYNQDIANKVAAEEEKWAAIAVDKDK
jgi:hypothetical protein